VSENGNGNANGAAVPNGHLPNAYENWLAALGGSLRGENGDGGGPALRERHQIMVDDTQAPPAKQAPRRPAGAQDPYAALKSEVQRAVIEKLGPQLFGGPEVADDLREPVHAAVVARLEETDTPLARDERRRLADQITDDILGFGPLEPFLVDDDVSEVMVNGHDQVYVERDGKIELTDASFADNAHLLRIIDRIVSAVGRRIDEASPMVDARLPDGSRVNAVIPPLALDGPALTIRKFSRDPYTLGNLTVFGTLSAEAASFLRACVAGRLNVLISGGTGTGKTTLLNALSACVPEHERIITIEDAAELQLQQRHTIRLEARPANIEGEGEIRIRELVRNALRMRPDRIIVGEVRGPETVDMLQAMNTGHEGSLTTIHANTPRDALSRLETLVLTAGIDLPLRAIREQIASAFDLIVHLSRDVDGGRRVSHVTEVLRMESDVVALQDLFTARLDERPDGEPETMRLQPTGLQPHFLDRLTRRGIELPGDVTGVVPLNGRWAR
jgi:pilus assembly protein CpaF